MNQNFFPAKKRHSESCVLFVRRLAWLGILFAFLLRVAPASRADETELPHPFHFGFSMSLMPEMNKNDVKAAMKYWTETVVKEGTVRGDPNLLFCETPSILKAALTNRQVDGVAMTTQEFFELRDRVKFNRFLVAQVDGGIYDQYVLLAQTGSGITNLESLQGHSLLIQRHIKMCLATPWLDTVLLEKKLGQASDFFGSVNAQPTANQTVLPVFFRKTDACLITRKIFQTMCELNPQLGQQLRVIAESPAVLTGGFFFRAGYPPEDQAKFVAEMAAVRNTPSGKQVLTVFQVDGMEEEPASVFDGSIALLEKHRQLLAATDGSQNLTKNAAANAAPKTGE